MDELVKLVAEKAGISESSARTAVKTVVDYLKKRLPKPIAGQVDRVLADDETVAQVTDKAEDLIKGFGKKK
jgi:peptide subunit release factor 1 (eRF1)